jgi:hypothetical protein
VTIVSSHRRSRRLLPGLLGLLLAVGSLAFSAPAAAHGNSGSNLDEQNFEVAPDQAEFTYSGDVDRSTARASLRYLGQGALAAEDYFRFDVPTVELTPVDATGTGPDFAFDLPRLPAGSYAVDWEVTPVGDHLASSMVLFEVTVGVQDPDPIPAAVAEPVLDDTATPEVGTAVPADGGDVSMLPLAGAALFLVLVAAGVLAVRRHNGTGK